MIAMFRCWWRGMHNPVRTPLGGQRCVECGFAGVDMDEMSPIGAGYQLQALRSTRDEDGGFVRRVGW